MCFLSFEVGEAMLLNSIFPEIEYAKLYKGSEYYKVKEKEKAKQASFPTPSLPPSP